MFIFLLIFPPVGLTTMKPEELSNERCEILSQLITDTPQTDIKHITCKTRCKMRKEKKKTHQETQSSTDFKFDYENNMPSLFLFHWYIIC